jgi:protoheme IX farnesyltransferase
MEADLDAKMGRTANRPMAKGRISSKVGCMVGTGLFVSSLAAYHMFVPFTWIVSSSVWFMYLCVYLPMKQKSEYNTLMGAVVGAIPPFIGTFA